MSPARPLTELVHPSWAEALQPVAAQVAALGDFLRAQIAAGQAYLPPGDQVLRAFARPLPEAVSYTHLDVYKRQAHGGLIADGSELTCQEL